MFSSTKKSRKKRPKTFKSEEKAFALDISIDSIYTPVPAGGDTFPYNLSLQNLTQEPQTADLRIDLIRPNGGSSQVLPVKTPC